MNWEIETNIHTTSAVHDTLSDSTGKFFTPSMWRHMISLLFQNLITKIDRDKNFRKFVLLRWHHVLLIDDLWVAITWEQRHRRQNFFVLCVNLLSSINCSALLVHKCEPFKPNCDNAWQNNSKNKLAKVTKQLKTVTWISDANKAKLRSKLPKINKGT